MNNGVTAVNTAVMGSLHAVIPRYTGRWFAVGIPLPV